MNIPQRISNILAQQIRDYYCLAMWDYGSVVYKNKIADDHDIVIVIKDVDVSETHFKIENFDIQLYTETQFKNMLHEHNVMALECINLPTEHVHVFDKYFSERISGFKIDLPTLRSSFSQVSSNSYVKAKKKLIIEQDCDLECSIKSMWHSMRIMQFGTQLATTGKIKNYQESNHLYPIIIQNYIDSSVNWEEIHKILKPLHNQLCTEFKLHAPKKI